MLASVTKEMPDLVSLGRTRKARLKKLILGSTASLPLAQLTCDAFVAGRLGLVRSGNISTLVQKCLFDR